MTLDMSPKRMARGATPRAASTASPAPAPAPTRSSPLRSSRPRVKHEPRSPTPTTNATPRVRAGNADNYKATPTPTPTPTTTPSATATPTPAPTVGDEQEHSEREEATPFVSELELESAILRGVSTHRPIGQHRHILALGLQADVHEMTGIWVPMRRLWDTLASLYDLEALDHMSTSTPSLPPSPESLSPVTHPSNRRQFRRGQPRSRSRSASSLSSPSPSPSASPSQTPTPSRSAAVINSSHFSRAFELPVLWYTAAATSGRLRSDPRTLSGSSRHRTVSTGPGSDVEGDNLPEWDSDAEAWATLIYARAQGDEEEDDWDLGVKQQLERNESELRAARAGSDIGPGKTAGQGRSAAAAANSAGAPKRRGRAPAKRLSGASAVSANTSSPRDMSPFSTTSDAGKKGRSGATSTRAKGKRARDADGGASEDEKPARSRRR